MSRQVEDGDHAGSSRRRYSYASAASTATPPLVESFEVRILAQQTFDLQATDRWLLGRQPS
ncbi:hypothetical protein M419DRAFT_9859 [Trichoderma reesei RUT C-30]|uniref:Uncharacterized protein n=1 Tax=Hypocrea jecorina (strain ATCC 56765 / BCRC 32924 / NRRL 11460 / Rut C-30) TaxID=1344414 RepID=A0A024S950_HYPJR|nr:hypothetical protein M419DRAFT_9859 [Trichoderma reesei RUT C-30]